MTTIEEGQPSVGELNRVEALAEDLHKRGSLLYIGLLPIVPFVFLNVPFVRNTVWNFAAGLQAGLTQDGMTPSEAGRPAVGFAALLATWALVMMVRGLYSEIAAAIARGHAVNTALGGSTLTAEQKSIVLLGAQAKHAQGWIRMRPAGGALQLAPGNWLRSAIVVFFVTALTLRANLPAPGVDSESEAASGADARSGASATSGVVMRSLASVTLPAATGLYDQTAPSAVQRLREASSRGDGDASHLLARMHIAGMLVPRNNNEALRLAELAVTQGSRRAMSWLGNRMLWGFDVPEDRQRGLILLKKAYEFTGSPPDAVTLYRMGLAYWFGGGVPRDQAAAVPYFSRALAAGYPVSAVFLGDHENAANRPAEAVKQWRIAAAAGHADSQWALYDSFYNGRGVPQDDRAARNWLLRAARQGHALAQAWLGYHYDLGRIIGKDAVESLRWSLRSAAKGNASGMFAAAAQFERIANSSHNRDAHKLAYMFYNLAAANGDQRAPPMRDTFAARLSPAEREDAQAGANVFADESQDVRKLELSGVGTGFFVDVGAVITNEHVIGECAKVAVETPTELLSDVTIRAANADLDLAILDVRAEPGRTIARGIATFSPSEPSLGERATAFGFPLTGTLASAGSLTDGTVTALAGVHDDDARLQFSTPVQPGNSGGALLDERGRVIGVVQAGLNPIAQGAEVFIPQNVNFGIKSQRVRELLVALGYSPRVGPREGATIDLKARGELAQWVSVRVRCYVSPVERTLNELRPR